MHASSSGVFFFWVWPQPVDRPFAHTVELPGDQAHLSEEFLSKKKLNLKAAT
jgi:hypothetical protein